MKKSELINKILASSKLTSDKKQVEEIVNLALQLGLLPPPIFMDKHISCGDGFSFVSDCEVFEFEEE